MVRDGAAKLVQAMNEVRVFDNGRQIGQMGFHITPVKPALANQYGARVPDVRLPTGEQFHDDKIFRRAYEQPAIRKKLHAGSALDNEFFIWQGRERYIDANAAGTVQQKDAAAKRELTGVGDARRVTGEQKIDILLLAAESGEQANIDVTREAGLTPTLDGDSTNDAESARMAFEEFLKSPSLLDEVNHCAAI